ncbi:MAG: ERF family protein [Clostridia bacterium]|nr:ERF family protein [Clostridia bacterium]
MSIKEKLLIIQTKLKAPKGQLNSYGGYSYRSCEDILEMVKPLLKANHCILTISDEIVMVGDRYYIKATATITDVENNDLISNVAYAREEEAKKGMDGAQITGTASSYARKYALNGLFCIDDTKDADTDEHFRETGAEPKEEKKASAKQIELLKGLVKDIDAMLKYYKVEKIEDLTTKQASETISKLKGAK